MAEASAKRRRVEESSGGGGGGEVLPLDKDGFFSYAVYAALRNCDEDMLQRITDHHSVDAQNRYGKTLLMLAASRGNVASVRFLIERGAAVNIQENNGKWTALHWAHQGKFSTTEVFEEVLVLLLRAGSDPTIKDKYGRTPRECVFEVYLLI